MTSGYCIKCKVNREIAKPVPVKLNKIPAIKGSCPVCATVMFHVERADYPAAKNLNSADSPLLPNK